MITIQTNRNPKYIFIGKWLFNEIDLNDKLLFDKFNKETEYPATIWSSNFTYLWASSQPSNRKTVWKIIDGMLVPFFYNVRHQYPSPVCLPFGKGDAEHAVKDHNVEGLSGLLLCELVKESYRANSSVEYMNDGSDLGDQGLRFFKERFRPELNLNRYRVYLKNFNYR